MAGARAFRSAWQASGSPDGGADFGAWETRKVRYSMLWGYLDSSVYSEVNGFAGLLKSDYGLYKYIRAIYNPASRIADFWQTHIWGGPLDLSLIAPGVPAAGAGGALPIVCENPALRVGIAQLWKDSNWQIKKDVVTLWGAALGDYGLKVVDDTARGKVYLEPVHPASIVSVTLDPFGNCKGYELEEERPDPRTDQEKTVRYGEAVYRGESPGEVVFETTLDDQPWDWTGSGYSTWSVPYGFVPFVVGQHNNVGAEWGWSEVYPGLVKLREVDDLASKLSDQIRKTIDPVWLFSGVDKPSTTPTITETESTDALAEPGRQELKALYGPVGASAHALVAGLDIGGTLAHIGRIMDEFEHDFPELQLAQIMLGDTSGVARKVAQQVIEPKVTRRRAGYDDVLRRAQAMAVAIGGLRKYPAYAGFNLDSYAAGALEHSIGPRDVFGKTPADALDLETQLWQAATAAQGAGVPLPFFLQRQGWSQGQIQAVVEWRAYEQAALAAAMAREQQ